MRLKISCEALLMKLQNALNSMKYKSLRTILKTKPGLLVK